MYLVTDENGGYVRQRAVPKTDRERAEIAKVVHAKFGENSMHVSMPEFCDYCKQYQRLGESKFCQRCIQTMANMNRDAPLSRQHKIFLVSVFAGGILLVLAIMYFAPGEQTGGNQPKQHTSLRP